jgi:NAD(P)H-hydrate epimerase
VSLVCDKADLPAYAAQALSLITQTQDKWNELLSDERINTVLIGPGAGVTEKTRTQVLAALNARKRAVLDADALTVFANQRAALFNAIHSPCIFTPHAGEFVRLFPSLIPSPSTGEGKGGGDRGSGNIPPSLILPRKGGGKINAALKAARLSHAVVVLKGYDTVIAAPDGRVAVNTNAPPTLATAGAGDVLAGICAGLLAQGMDAFDAACAGVWIHAEAARQYGAGLIAEGLIGCLPSVLQTLEGNYGRNE